VALAALISFAKVQESNRGYKKKVERLDKNHLEKSQNLYKLPYIPFRYMGKGKGRGGSSPRQPFKNLR
jgi:hypothetical protein